MVWAICIGGQGGAGDDGKASSGEASGEASGGASGEASGGEASGGEASGGEGSGGEGSSRAAVADNSTDTNFMRMSVRMSKQVQGRWGMTTIFIIWMVC